MCIAAKNTSLMSATISHLAVKSHFFLPGSTEPPVTAKTPGCIASRFFSLSSGISLHFTTKTITSELRPTVTAPCHLPVAISSPTVLSHWEHSAEAWLHSPKVWLLLTQTAPAAAPAQPWQHWLQTCTSEWEHPCQLVCAGPHHPQAEWCDSQGGLMG